LLALAKPEQPIGLIKSALAVDQECVLSSPVGVKLPRLCFLIIARDFEQGCTMSRITDSSLTGSASPATTRGGGFSAIDTDQFMKLLIAELQNQDPLEPMKNSDMVQQMSQIRNIGATDQLTRTLSNLRESQELVTASGLIGQKVQGLADDTTQVNGVVDRITVETDSQNDGRNVKVHVGNQTMQIRNIRTILNS
jgi:flagellar basal-body rod modification protein FlgD